MSNKPRVRSGLSSPEQSKDVEFAIDKQIDRHQQFSTLIAENKTPDH